MDLPLVQVVELVVRNGPVTDTAGLPRVMAAPLLFVSTIRVEVLVVPIAWAGNTAAAGAKDTLLVPVPVMPASCGLVGSLSLIDSTPFFAPVLLGVKVKLDGACRAGGQRAAGDRATVRKYREIGGFAQRNCAHRDTGLALVGDSHACDGTGGLLQLVAECHRRSRNGDGCSGAFE